MDTTVRHCKRLAAVQGADVVQGSWPPAGLPVLVQLDGRTGIGNKPVWRPPSIPSPLCLQAQVQSFCQFLRLLPLNLL